METNFIYNHVFRCERLNEPMLSYNDNKRISQNAQAENVLRAIYEKENIDLAICEVCIALLLNNDNKITGYYKVSQGGTTFTIIDTKMIVKAALDTFSSGVILCHNHPSGNPRPNQADIRETEKLQKGLDFFGIRLLDHIILTEDNAFYCSSNTSKKPMGE